MKRVSLLFLLLIQMALYGVTGVQAQAVTGVTAGQRIDNSGLVDIGYTLSGASGPTTVSVRVSPDGGTSWYAVPSVTGDVGAGINNGTRAIVWNALADAPDIHRSTVQVKVTATDGSSGGEITITLPGGEPLVLVRIPAGSFQMGSPPDEQDRDFDEGPVHTVNIGYDFYMGKYELTKAQWAAVMGTTPWNGEIEVLSDPDSPAVYVSWNDAQAFASALNTHITNTSQGPATIRLPSEAEWEYACRAETTTRFYWGDDLSYTDIGDYEWYQNNAWSVGEEYAHVVGQKLPNPWGLYDMSGNVSEWCQDDRLGDYTGAPTDGSAWGDGSALNRTLRSGTWFSWPGYCRSAFRYYYDPSEAFSSFGFRLATVRSQAVSGLFDLDTRGLVTAVDDIWEYYR